MTAVAPLLETRVQALEAQLRDIVQSHPSAVFATSFGAEDMVLFDLLARDFRQVDVITLDTGRLPEETYALWRRAQERYSKKIVPFVPQAAPLQAYIRINGVNGFYDSIAQRKECCAVRKVEPLRRALAQHSAWITGQRRAQSRARAELAVAEYDQTHQMAKFNPLADWSDDEVWAYLASRDVPYNVLHDQGYPSIGCAPCTRAVQPGEDQRAGRWWWEADGAKECGLHVADQGVSA